MSYDRSKESWGSNRYWADGNYGRGLVGFIDLAGVDKPETLIAEVITLINDKSNPLV